MQFLVRKTTHTTGETFTDVTKIRDNETYQVVEAESKEEAEKMAMGEVILRNGINSLANGMRNMRKAMQRKDSEWMAKYMLKPPFNVSVGDRDDGPGKIYEVKKLKHPVILGNKKHKYIEVNTQHFMTKKFIKDKFTKGTYKSETLKRIFNTLLIIALYELSKAITYELIVKKQANDMVEQPGYDEIDAWKKY